MNRALIASLIITGLALPACAMAAQAELSNAVIPYGDYCNKCSHYGGGSVRPAVMHHEAEDALVAYFNDRGLGVQRVMGMGRFLQAEVVKNGKVIDRIIFDRKTGRIRSIY